MSKAQASYGRSLRVLAVSKMISRAVRGSKKKIENVTMLTMKSSKTAVSRRLRM